MPTNARRKDGGRTPAQLAKRKTHATKRPGITMCNKRATPFVLLAPSEDEVSCLVCLDEMELRNEAAEPHDHDCPCGGCSSGGPDYDDRAAAH